MNGNKTYVIAALIVGVTLLHTFGYIDDSTWQMLLGILNGGAVTTLAMKGNRIEAKTDAIQNKM